MIDAVALTDDARSLVLEVEDDLRRVLAADAEKEASWRAEHAAALRGNRTSAAFVAWRDDHITQVAVSWVLTTVFVRFLEDNALVEPVWFAGTGPRRREAVDAETHYFRQNPEHTARDWVLQAIGHLQELPATKMLVDEHAPLWQLSISGRMAERIIEFWRATDDEGALQRSFQDEDLDTRFLGDLYQDLSEHAKATYALLQTPEFVEEFILDQTMEPALAERPLEGFTIIDPTCGSGHFLLGAFHRLVTRWQKHAPAFNSRQIVERALESVVGVDINSFAVAIARFRLLLAALTVTGETTLKHAPELTVRVFAGDSLLPWGTGQQTLLGDAAGVDADLETGFAAERTEDRDALHDALKTGQYDAVVGNPPYIVVSDSSLRSKYRKLYATAIRQFALTVPFMERFFALAKPSVGDQPAGWVGQITSNSFMSREFGVKLVEEFLVAKDLQLVVDTSGAQIPGHHTQTLILVGKHRTPVREVIRAVLGVRGEPGQPVVASEGLVWSSIVQHVRDSSFENEFITVTELPRRALASHPWSLQGGASGEIQRVVEQRADHALIERIDGSIGRSIRAGSDDSFLRPLKWVERSNLSAVSKPVVVGESVRDYGVRAGDDILYPYVEGRADSSELSDVLWFLREGLRQRGTFKGNMADAGRVWWEYMQHTQSAYASPFSITFACISTHNHFVLDRGGKVFKQSAPVIKLPVEATEDEHLNLLGVLNSSIALFWLKQNSYNKNTGTGGGGMVDQPWSWNYDFTGTTLQDFPLVDTDFTTYGRSLDTLASEKAAAEPDSVKSKSTPTRELLDEARARWESLRGQMVAQQEELDWFTYRAYGITDHELTYAGGLPEVRLGERAFEIALARRVAAGEETTAWFERHRSTPITKIPDHWPSDYRQLVQRRLDLIESDRKLNLLERPEYKRRWAEDPWETKVDRALRTWLLDRLEERSMWFDRQGRPVTRSIAQLADIVGRDEEMRSVIELWRGITTVDLVKALTELLTPEAVPFLAAWRLKPKAMDKFRAWQETWQLQRDEDAGKDVGTIPVPPKYTSADFRKSSYMALRGKLDVPNLGLSSLRCPSGG